MPRVRWTPLPLVGRGWGWGSVLEDHASRHNYDPPPQPSPTRGEGAHRACGSLIPFQRAQLYCPEPEVRAHRAANAIANFGFKRGTTIIELLVVLKFRSSQTRAPRNDANFGIGPLARNRSRWNCDFAPSICARVIFPGPCGRVPALGAQSLSLARHPASPAVARLGQAATNGSEIDGHDRAAPDAGRKYCRP